ncbi:DUF3078 domain-containing protein [Rhodocaloribacter litoris]|uniref:DUF3078 domain-containing protein n=1 Tax=Rhodocaloribacter litoris TaxID=2558931 RepID=UPI00141DA912|nr:DUF3078 domain-containing protein [Rhodocaloribacter litoris]QXD14256.1 DUF3078 domain-containing protein [Rhodocaloribacter litoris]
MLILGMTLLPARGQPAQKPDTSRSWKTDLIATLSATQAGFNNWQGGGVNSLALSTGLNGEARRTNGRWAQKHTLRLTIGVVKQDTLDFRKAEDVIRLASNLSYQGEGFFSLFSPTVAASIRTQFAEGFNFDKDPIFEKNPVGAPRKPPVKVSDFFSPAILQQSIGLTYDPNHWFTQRIGVAAKETIVLIERLRVLYGVDPADAVRFELGMEAVSELNREVFKNVRYKSTLGLFASFNKPETPDFLWENLVNMKVNAWLQVNFEFVALLDKDLSDRFQLKEVLAVGISYALL